MTYAARVDSTQAGIVAALRAYGCKVHDASGVGHGFPDLVCATTDDLGRPVVLLFECKAKGGKLSAKQREFHATWGAWINVVYSADEALAVVARVRGVRG